MLAAQAGTLKLCASPETFHAESLVLDLSNVPERDLPDTIPEGVRNRTLFGFACKLQGAGLPDGIIHELAEKANAERCTRPLDPHELDRLVASAVSYEKCSGKFRHDIFAEMLIACHHVSLVDGTPIVWVGERYEAGKEALESEMLKIQSSLTLQQRREVLSYLQHRAPKIESPTSRHIAFMNGVLNIESGELLPNSPHFHIPNTIPHDWNESAQCQVLDNALDQWSCGRREVRANLEEIIGLCMYRGRELHICPLLTGEGSNGKSTYLNMLVGILGQENVSSLDIARIGERFQSVALMGKLANIGDDISRDRLSGKTLAVAKKAISGDWLDAEYKGGATFSIRPYCTLVFSANEVPRMGDNSEGIYRRFVPVAFDGVFDEGLGNRNIRLWEALSSEDACERAIYLGIQGLQRCLSNGRMTATSARKEQIENMRRQNSSVHSFCEDELQFGTPEAASIVGEPTGEHFKDYERYCEAAGLKPVSRNTYSTEICRIYGVGTGKEYRDFADGRKQVRVFVSKNSGAGRKAAPTQ